MVQKWKGNTEIRRVRAESKGKEMWERSEGECQVKLNRYENITEQSVPLYANKTLSAFFLKARDKLQADKNIFKPHLQQRT